MCAFIWRTTEAIRSGQSENVRIRNVCSREFEVFFDGDGHLSISFISTSLDDAARTAVGMVSSDIPMAETRTCDARVSGDARKREGDGQDAG